MSDQTFINLWLGGLTGLEASAHPSLEDALDDISSPAEGAKYRGTLIPGLQPETWIEVDFSADAREYAERVTREWREQYASNIKLMNAQACGR